MQGWVMKMITITYFCMGFGWTAPSCRESPFDLYGRGHITADGQPLPQLERLVSSSLVTICTHKVVSKKICAAVAIAGRHVVLGAPAADEHVQPICR